LVKSKIGKSMNQMTRVMLVEDHPEYRKVIQLSLEDQDDIELTFQVGSAERAIAVLEDPQTQNKVDLILLDLNLPGMSGLDALNRFRTIAVGKQIIILSQTGKEADVVRAIQNGASGYLLKSATATQIIDAIRIVAAGGALLDPGVAKFVLSSIQSRAPTIALEKELSERELQILVLLGQGLVKKEVAKELGIKTTSVATYIRRIYEKLERSPFGVFEATRLT